MAKRRPGKRMDYVAMNTERGMSAVMAFMPKASEKVYQAIGKLGEQDFEWVPKLAIELSTLFQQKKIELEEDPQRIADKNETLNNPKTALAQHYSPDEADTLGEEIQDGLRQALKNLPPPRGAERRKG